MRPLKSLLVLLVVSCLCGFSFSLPKERLWVSLVTKLAEKSLMQIDSKGNIVLPPFKVSEGATTHGTAQEMALSANGDGALNVWFVKDGGQVFRIAVDKQTLKTLSVTKTKMNTIPVGAKRLDVTHRAENNLVAINVNVDGGVRTAAYPVDIHGKVTGRSRLITPPVSSSCDDCMGGLAGNRFVYWTDYKSITPHYVMDLFIRPLSPGRSQVFVDRVTSRGSPRSHFGYADATQELPGGKSFLVYVKVQYADERPYRLFLQQIESSTGQKQGAPILLYRSDGIGIVKIDPLGRFLLFTDEDSRLAYLSLDATGHPSGTLKVLLPFRSVLTDLLREKL
jgi:hypothetical protein